MKDGAEGETGAGDEQRGRDTPQDSHLFMFRCSAANVHRCLLVVLRSPESDHTLVVFTEPKLYFLFYTRAQYLTNPTENQY